MKDMNVKYVAKCQNSVCTDIDLHAPPLGNMFSFVNHDCLLMSQNKCSDKLFIENLSSTVSFVSMLFTRPSQDKEKSLHNKLQGRRIELAE